LDAFMPLGAMGSSYVAVYVFQEGLRSEASDQQAALADRVSLWQI
jgi:hypothetical protein